MEPIWLHCCYWGRSVPCEDYFVVLCLSYAGNEEGWRQGEKQTVGGRDAAIESTGKYSLRVCARTDDRPCRSRALDGNTLGTAGWCGAQVAVGPRDLGLELGGSLQGPVGMAQ